MPQVLAFRNPSCLGFWDEQQITPSPHLRAEKARGRGSKSQLEKAQRTACGQASCGQVSSRRGQATTVSSVVLALGCCAFFSEYLRVAIKKRLNINAHIFQHVPVKTL